jgi:hypothetical protein
MDGGGQTPVQIYRCVRLPEDPVEFFASGDFARSLCEVKENP